MSGLRAISGAGQIFIAAGLVVAATLLGTVSGNASGMMGGGGGSDGGDRPKGGFIFNLDITKMPLLVKPPAPATQPGCRAPMYYSPDFHKCVYPAKQTITCAYPMVKQGSTCVCAGGFNWNGRACVKQPTVIKTPPVVIDKKPPVVVKTKPLVIQNPPVADTPPPVDVDKPPVVGIDVNHIQECLAKLGYDPGPQDGTINQATRTAFRAYQQENGLDKRPFYLGDKPTQTKLFQMCDAPAPPPATEASLEPVTRAAQPVTDPTPPPPPPPATPIKPLAQRCLAPDLYDLLKKTYGKDPGLPPCTPDTAVCVPKPLFYSEAKLASVAASSGVTWCGSCIRLGSYLPLSTIQEIESKAGITLCASPPALCYLPGRPVVEKQVEIRTIYKDLPVGVGNEGDIAVVIGNETYQNDITPHVYGHADADAVVQLLTEQLGYRKDHIIDLRDAKLADFEKIFGTADNPNGELASRIKAQGSSPGDVIVYISGHGLSKEEGGEAWLLPVDGKTDDVDHTGYPVQQLYTNLGKAGARTIMLMLEATFGTTITDAVDAPNIPQLEVMDMPQTPVPGLAVFTASDRDQHALEDPEYGIGLFTRYMIAGLAGDADAAPIGNGDKRIDTVELYVYATDMVRTAARKSFGMEQKPILSKIDNLLVGTLASN